MKKVTWDMLPSIIAGETQKIVEHHTKLLYMDIVSVWPVKSGKSKASWRVRKYVSGHYAVVNFARAKGGYNYVADLWIGEPVGSSQLPNGGDPILKRHHHMLTNDLEGMTL